MSISTQEKRRRFRALHEHGLLILPNPWDTRQRKTARNYSGAQALALAAARPLPGHKSGRF